MRESELREEAQRLPLFVEHRDGRRRASEQTERRRHRHARRSAPEALARPRIEQMRVANAVDDHAALVVAARRDPARDEGDAGDGLARSARIADADLPGRSVRSGTDHREIAAEIDEPRPDARLAAERGDPIRGVLLHEAAEVELHSRERQHEPRPLPAELRPADERARRFERPGLGERVRTEIPDPAQHAGGRIEAPAALAMGRRREVEQRRRLLVDLEAARVAGAPRDRGGEAVLAVARVLDLEPRDLARRASRDRRERLPRSARELELAGAPHRAKAEGLEAHRQKRPVRVTAQIWKSTSAGASSSSSTPTRPKSPSER